MYLHGVGGTISVGISLCLGKGSFMKKMMGSRNLLTAMKKKQMGKGIGGKDKRKRFILFFVAIFLVIVYVAANAVSIWLYADRDEQCKAYSSPTSTTRYISLKTKLPFLAREVFFYIGYKWYRWFD